MSKHGDGLLFTCERFPSNMVKIVNRINNKHYFDVSEMTMIFFLSKVPNKEEEKLLKMTN